MFFTIILAIKETIVAVLGLMLEAKDESTLARRQDHVTKLLSTVMAPRLFLFGMRFFGGRQFFAHGCV